MRLDDFVRSRWTWSKSARSDPGALARTQLRAGCGPLSASCS